MSVPYLILDSIYGVGLIVLVALYLIIGVKINKDIYKLRRKDEDYLSDQDVKDVDSLREGKKLLIYETTFKSMIFIFLVGLFKENVYMVTPLTLAFIIMLFKVLKKNQIMNICDMGELFGLYDPEKYEHTSLYGKWIRHKEKREDKADDRIINGRKFW